MKPDTGAACAADVVIGNEMRSMDEETEVAGCPIINKDGVVVDIGAVGVYAGGGGTVS